MKYQVGGKYKKISRYIQIYLGGGKYQEILRNNKKYQGYIQEEANIKKYQGYI